MGGAGSSQAKPGGQASDRRFVRTRRTDRTRDASSIRRTCRFRDGIRTTSAKSCADLIAQSYAITYHLPVVISRCANLYGGGDMNWNRLVPGTIRSALRGRASGDSSDGRPLRDYPYVQDGVAAYPRLAEALDLDRGLAGLAFNFGHAEPIGVLELVTKILAIADRADLVPEIRGNANHEIPDQYLDPTRAQRVLGWRAQSRPPRRPLARAVVVP